MKKFISLLAIFSLFSTSQVWANEPVFQLTTDLQLNPIKGLTTQNLVSPTTFAVTRGMTVSMTVTGHGVWVNDSANGKNPGGALGSGGQNAEVAFQWEILQETDFQISSVNLQWTSTASYTFANPGRYTVRVTPVVNGQATNLGSKSADVVVYDMRLDQIQISMTHDAIDEHQGMPIFWYLSTHTMTAVANPIEFTPLLEWADENKTFLQQGAQFTKSFYQPGKEAMYITLNRLGEANYAKLRHSASCLVIKTNIITYPSVYEMSLGKPCIYEAQTTPSGYEDYVHWSTDTMHGMAGTVAPVQGQGKFFRTQWNLTNLGSETTPRYWFGLSANEFQMGGDIVPLVPPVAGPPDQNPISEMIDSDGLMACKQCAETPPFDTTLPDDQINRSGSAMALPHSGQVLLDTTDMILPGRDGHTNLAIKRRHLSRMDYQNSIFGTAWAFNYQYTLNATNPSGDVIVNSFGRNISYVPDGTNAWTGASGQFFQLTYDGSQFYELRIPSGVRLVFHSEAVAGGRVGHLTNIISPNNNSIAFRYETAAQQPTLLSRRLLEITESYGRSIQFFYNDPDFSKGVSRILDFSGREFFYDYDSLGHLLSFTAPAVNSTLGLNDFPNGKKTQYTYINNPNANLKNNLLAVIYPNQDATGYTRMTFTYLATGDTNGFINSFKLGNPVAPGDLAAGGTYQYSYEFLTSQIDPGANTAYIRTTITDRRGSTTLIESNRFGQVLSEKINANTSLRPNPPSSSYERTYKYNTDGSMTKSTDVLGEVRNYTYSSDTSQPRTSQGNATQQVKLADSRGGEQSSIKTQTTYEPVFNKPFQIVNPRGFETGNAAADFTTTFYYDYMEDLSSAKAAFAPQLGLSQAELQALFDAAGILDLGAVDLNGDGVTNQFCGNLIKVTHPIVNLPSAATQLGLSTTQTAEEFFRYNQFGQKTFHLDEELNVHEWAYYGADDPDGNGTIDVVGADSSTGGYRKMTIRDTTSQAGRNSGVNSPPVNQTTLFEYTAQNSGAFPENLRGVPTAIIDPRGIKKIYLVNELDQVIIQAEAFDVSASPEPGLIAFAYENRIFFDANNNIIEAQIQNKDTLDNDNDFVVYQFGYNILDQLKKTLLDTGSGNLNIETRYFYDANQNLILKTQGFGTVDEASESWTYDERDRLFQNIKAPGQPEESILTYNIDANGNMIETVDADGGDITSYIYDGYDRLKIIIDREFNESEYFYDSAANMVETQLRGNVDEADLTKTTILSREITSYDERDRAFRFDTEIKHYPGKSVGQIDDGALAPTNDGFVSQLTIFDKLNRSVGFIDADNDLQTFEFDGLGRLIRSIDALENEQINTYDQNDNLLTTNEIEKSLGLIASDEQFLSQYTYDALNRGELNIEPNGQTSTQVYDSRSNPIKTIDPLGNEIEYRYDRIDRLVENRTYLSANGENASAGNFDSSQAGDGRITLLSTWDALHRLKTRGDDRGQTTSYTYDDLNRRTLVDYQDGTFETMIYNADSEMLAHVNQNGSIETWTYDSDSRPLQTSINNSAAPSTTKGTTLKTFGYDGLNRLTLSTDNNDPGDSSDNVTYRNIYDSLSRIIRESQTVGTAPTLHVDYEWQGQIRNVSHTYPNGRIIDCVYDALDRKSVISENATSNTIVGYQYVGPFRGIITNYGNGAILDKRNQAGTQTISGTNAGYDSNRRPIYHEWKDASSNQIVAYVNGYNGVGGIGSNRRVFESRLHFSHRDDYTFDSRYRMTAFERDQDLAQMGGVNSTRSLDGTDNMTAFIHEGANQSPVIDGIPAEAGVNQYSSFVGQARTHDDNGALITDSNLNYFYDYQNRLAEVKDSANTTIASFAYAADNRRILKTTPALATRYLYKDWQVVEERNFATSAVLRQYVDGRGTDEHIQLKDYTQGGNPEYYYHSNSQGFVGALSDQSGNPIEFYEYSWLGTPRITDGVLPLSASLVGNSYMFHGRRYDAEIDLYYFRNRYYDHKTGRFIVYDPLGNWEHGQGNGYAAFAEDGWNYSDPFGLDEECCEPNTSKDVRATKFGLKAADHGVLEPVESQIKDLEKFFEYVEKLDILQKLATVVTEGAKGAADVLAEEIAAAYESKIQNGIIDLMEKLGKQLMKNDGVVILVWVEGTCCDEDREWEDEKQGYWHQCSKGNMKDKEAFEYSEEEEKREAINKAVPACFIEAAKGFKCNKHKKEMEALRPKAAGGGCGLINPGGGGCSLSAGLEKVHVILAGLASLLLLGIFVRIKTKILG